MAWLEEHPTSGHFKICFRFGNRKLKKTIKTTNKREAEGALARFEENLRLLERGRIELPPGADIGTFLLSDGKLAANPTLVAPVRPLLLKDLCDMYVAVQSNGAIEANSLRIINVHLGHFKKSLGESFPIATLEVSHLQNHVDRRTRKQYRDRPLSAVTLQKEMASLRACWAWGVQAGKLKVVFPGKGLKFPKTDEKPPFQTRAEIERQIARGGLSGEIRELWHSLFLHRSEIDELLAYIRNCLTEPFLYPMVCLAAHTGTRHSELLRLRIDDVDFATGTLVVHEKKRARGRRTTRRVPLSGFAQETLKEWLKVHPGGQHLFCRMKGGKSVPLVGTDAFDKFKEARAASKWAVLRGWHILRHSFASNCAATGIDQRLIDEWMGHQTEDMVRRYRHLFPDQQRKAINLVFG